jgi:ABC-type multidrug transport system fused ATPase/permease subunit
VSGHNLLACNILDVDISYMLQLARMQCCFSCCIQPRQFSLASCAFFIVICIATHVLIHFSFRAFATFVARGNELTVSIAFTAIALFNMVRYVSCPDYCMLWILYSSRAPLNVIPTWIVNLSQTKVAVDRIQTFLNEEEVSDQVSSLKKRAINMASADALQTHLMIKNGSFKWNEVEGGRTDAESLSSQPDSRFELRDVDVELPENELTVVTGPTASGKTALLVRSSVSSDGFDTLADSHHRHLIDGPVR